MQQSFKQAQLAPTMLHSPNGENMAELVFVKKEASVEKKVESASCFMLSFFFFTLGEELPLLLFPSSSTSWMSGEKPSGLCPY